MKRRNVFITGFLSILFIIFIITTILKTVVYAEPEEMPETSSSYVLIESETGTVLNGKNENEKLPVGTLVKLMTVLLAAEKIEDGTWTMDTVLTATDCVTGIKGAVIWLVAGETMTVRDLFKGIIIGNANDAAAVFAESISGSQEAFVMDMNARAFDLGMKNTIFTNPQGYDDPAQFSTAYDISLICRKLYSYDFLNEFFNTWRDFLRGEDTELVSENTLIRTYEGHIGWKASHTEASGWCIAEGAEKNGMTCITVVLGSTEDERFQLCKNLLAKGFSSYKVTLPSFSTEFLKPVSVHGGIDKAVCITANNLIGLVVPKNNPELKTVMVLPNYINAPVSKGRKIGIVAFYQGDTLLYETEIITTDEVKEMTLQIAFKKMIDKMLKI